MPYNKSMQRIAKKDIASVHPFFQAAARIAAQATCQRARCGAVIVKDGEIIGQGFNGPALGREDQRTCQLQHDLSIKPTYDKTCCIHAEWRAIVDALRRNSAKITGATLYFMRIDDTGNFTDAGLPYCTTCSRLTLESEVDYFALWNNGGADMYDAGEYNLKSYEFSSRAAK